MSANFIRFVLRCLSRLCQHLRADQRLRLYHTRLKTPIPGEAGKQRENAHGCRPENHLVLSSLGRIWEDSMPLENLLNGPGQLCVVVTYIDS